MDLSSVISPLLGVVVGTFLEPLKAWLTRISESKGARREIYLELAQYFEDIKEAANGDAGYGFWEKAREKPPTFPRSIGINPIDSTCYYASTRSVEYGCCNVQ